MPLRLLGRLLSEWRTGWRECQKRVVDPIQRQPRPHTSTRALLVIATAANLGLSPAALEPVGSLRQWAHRKLGWPLQSPEKTGGRGPSLAGAARRAAQFSGEPQPPLTQTYRSYQHRQEKRRERRGANSNRS